MALTKFNYNSFDLTTVASTGLAFNSSANGFDTAAAGAMNLISTTTVSSSVSNIDITSGINSTYDTYIFKIFNLHCSDNNTKPSVNFSTDGMSSTATKTTTHFYSFNNEAGSQNLFSYDTGGDLAQSTSDQALFFQNMTNVDDASGSGTVMLFSPSSTTFVKHFIADFHCMGNPVASAQGFTAGYCNTTSAIDSIRFTMNSGTIDSCVIKMYGLTK
tara:strand:- start:42 stop:689 length:648 start_codon:yes stop_codon:yes gene_type:complete